MSALLQLLHAMAGLVVLAEALNKLERSAPLRHGLTPRQRLVDTLKALAWAFLAMGAGGAVAGPLLLASGLPTDRLGGTLRIEPPTLDQALVLIGFAVLVIRTRLKEG